MAEWTGFLAALAYNAGAAAVAHVPAWLPGVGIPRERVWLRRILLLESIAPIPGSVAAVVSTHFCTIPHRVRAANGPAGISSQACLNFDALHKVSCCCCRFRWNIL